MQLLGTTHNRPTMVWQRQQDNMVCYIMLSLLCCNGCVVKLVADNMRLAPYFYLMLPINIRLRGKILFRLSAFLEVASAVFVYPRHSSSTRFILVVADTDAATTFRSARVCNRVQGWSAGGTLGVGAGGLAESPVPSTGLSVKDNLHEAWPCSDVGLSWNPSCNHTHTCKMKCIILNSMVYASACC